MKAIVYDRYGPPDVLHLADVPQPEAGPGEVLVRVRAAAVTTADWRMRAAAYPGILWLPGRMMTGFLRPKHPVLGTDFAGEVVAAGPGASRFRLGDRVFGFSGRGAYAEYLTIAENGAVAATPDALSDAEAVALPFGAVSALVFLRGFAQLEPGQDVLILGASGGVGCYAVQIAKAMGAVVTGVASAANLDLVRDLGADRAIDYRAEDPMAGTDRYDLVFDAVGATDFARARPVLKPRGLFLPLNFGGREIVQVLLGKITGGKRIAIGVSGDSGADLDALKAMISAGTLRPVIDRIYPLDGIVEAHTYVEARHRRGAVVLSPMIVSPTA